MSLINDALKRAKQTHQKHAPPPANAPMRPVERPRHTAAPRSFFLPAVIAAVLMILGSAVMLAVFKPGSGGSSKPAEPVVASNKPINNPTVAKDPPEAIPVSAPVTTVVPTPAASGLQTPVTVATSPVPAFTTAPTIVTQIVVAAENPKPTPPPPSEPPPPPLPKLQGIVFNPANPTAFLNGKSLVVGGRMGEYTVVAITKQSVTVARAGNTNVLTMEE